MSLLPPLPTPSATAVRLLHRGAPEPGGSGRAVPLHRHSTAGGHGVLAGRRAAASGRVGDRRHLLRLAKVPLRAARSAPGVARRWRVCVPLLTQRRGTGPWCVFGVLRAETHCRRPTLVSWPRWRAGGAPLFLSERAVQKVLGRKDKVGGGLQWSRVVGERRTVQGDGAAFGGGAHACVLSLQPLEQRIHQAFASHLAVPLLLSGPQAGGQLLVSDRMHKGAARWVHAGVHKWLERLLLPRTPQLRTLSLFFMHSRGWFGSRNYHHTGLTSMWRVYICFALGAQVLCCQSAV